MSEVLATDNQSAPTAPVEGSAPPVDQKVEKHGATFAAFAKKERAIQQKMAESKALEAKLAQDLKEIEEYKALRGDKRKVLKHFGLNKEELKKLMDEEDLVPTAEDIQAMIQRGIKEQELEKLKEEEARAAQQEEAKKAELEQAVSA